MKKNLLSIIFALISTLGFSQAPNYVPANGLVGWWPFNGNADDESGNGNNGTVNGATLTTDRNGVVDKAYSFDGYNDLIRIQHQNTLNLMGDYSISVWYKGNYQNIFNNNWNFIAKRDDNGNCCSPNVPYQIAIPFNSTNYAVPLMVYANGNYTFSTLPNSSPISLDQWQNLIITNTSDLLKFYINGQLIFSENISSTLRAPNTSDLLIGSVNRELGVEWMNGKLDDIGIWNRALTQQEITNLYTSTVPVSCLPAYVPTSGLVGYWPFCGNANDESGNGNNGTVNGATLTTDRFGNANKAYGFDGVDDNIHVGQFNLTSDYSVSFWIFLNNSDFQYPIGFGINQFNTVDIYKGYGIGYSSTVPPCPGLGSSKYFVNDAVSTCNTWIECNSQSSPNQWNHIVVQKNGNLVSLYIDGVIDNSGNNLNLQGIIDLYFGVRSDLFAYFDGTLDDIGIWNRALTQQEITNLYTSTVPPTASVLSGDATICLGSSTNLSIAVTGGTAPYTITVTDGTNNYTATGASPVSIPVSPTATSTYTIVSVSGGGTGTGNTGTATVTITPSSTNTTPISACNSYSWNGQTYTQSGVYTGTTANCVTESLNLIITPSSTNTTTASACDSYAWNGTTYTSSGVYTGTTANCVTESLNLTITPNSTNTTAASACDSYSWNGTSYSASGTYTGTTANCVTESLNLTITPSSTNTTTASACNNYTWNGQTYTQSGIYTGTTTDCVTQALNLTINTNTSSSISQTALDSYTWPVNSQTYTTTGAYTAVIPNASGCDSTITLNLTMSFTGINDLSASKLSIYPNPTNGDFTIKGLELVGTVSSLTLTDMNGKVVKVLDTKATKFSMGSIKPGVYFLNIISENKQEVLKIVKE